MINQLIRLKILILPISLALVVVVLIFFIKPTFSDMNVVKESLSQKQLQLDGLNSQSQNLKKLASDWSVLGEEKTLVETALPETENVDTYVSELTSKASRSGILLLNVRTEEKSSGMESAGGVSYVCGENTEGDLAPVSTAETTMMAEGDLAGTPVSSSTSPSRGCLNMIKVSITAKGTWEQLLDFFKYLQEMNRISNIENVDISVDSQGQEQAASDLLYIVVSVSSFFKEKKQSGSFSLASEQLGQIQLNQKAIEKLQKVIYSPYSAPSVSPSGERNIFK